MVRDPRPFGSPAERAGTAVEVLAGPLLQFLAADAGRLDRFLAITGLTPATLRAAARGPGFAASLLDYVSSDEAMLLAFAAEAGRDPAELAALRRAITDDP